MDLDLLVVGSGVAGLSAAVRAAAIPGLRVGVLTKGELAQAATRWAQGGVAAVLAEEEDSIDLHLADTLAAGAGLCDVDAVRVLVSEGPARVNELIGLGAVFDRDHEGRLLLAREGGHSMPRVVHAGGAATGAEIERALVAAVRETAAELLEQWLSIDLLVEEERCVGVRALGPGGETRDVRARHTLLATGGAGQLFAVTTNPREATGDGIAMALRAHVPVADVEFMQFHPTALAHPAMPRPLLSEALRGHGAVLRDAKGEQFVDELAPRDVVARAMTARMLTQDVDNLWLDARNLEHFAERFPTINASLAEIGLDAKTDMLPIAPAAHYLSGGIVVDLDGATALPGLWACGETTCSGVHGANRLASNSLLDGMVFAARMVEAVESGKTGPDPTGAMRSVLGGDGDFIAGQQLTAASAFFGYRRPTDDVERLRHRVQRAMTTGAGVLRSEESLDTIERELQAVRAAFPRAESVGLVELRNLLAVGDALLSAARARQESRGAHNRTDFPDPSDDLLCRLVIS